MPSEDYVLVIPPLCPLSRIHAIHHATPSYGSCPCILITRYSMAFLFGLAFPLLSVSDGKVRLNRMFKQLFT